MFFPRELPRLLFHVDDACIFEYSYDGRRSNFQILVIFFFF